MEGFFSTQSSVQADKLEEKGPETESISAAPLTECVLRFAGRLA